VWFEERSWIDVICTIQHIIKTKEVYWHFINFRTTYGTLNYNIIGNYGRKQYSEHINTKTQICMKYADRKIITVQQLNILENKYYMKISATKRKSMGMCGSNIHWMKIK